MLLFAAYIGVLAALLFVPGLAVGLACRLRGLALAACAPPISVGIIGMAGIVLQKAALEFTPVSVSIVAVIVALVVLVVSTVVRRVAPRWFEHEPGGSRRDSVWTLGIFVATALLHLRTLRLIIPRSDLLAQGFDNPFHANAIQWAVQRHEASSLTLLSMTSGGQPPGFYPAAWHGLVSLPLMVIPHADVTIGINATTYALIALAWPLGVLFLARTLLPFSRVALGAAGVLSLVLPAFPLKFLQWGPLFPNELAMVCTPAVLALIALALRAGLGPRRVGLAPVLLAGAVALVGVALAHPSSVILLLIYLDAIVIQQWLGALRHRRDPDGGHRRFMRASIGAGIGLLVSLVMWIGLRPPPESARWEPIAPLNWDLALMSVVTQAGGDPRAVALLPGALVILGILVSLRRRWLLWLVGAQAFLAAIFIIGAVEMANPVRYWLTGTWYSDHQRVAALLVFGSIVFGAVGTVAVGEALAGWWGRLRDGGPQWLRRPIATAAAVAVVAGAGVWVSMHSGGFQLSSRNAMLTYSSLYNGELVDDAERQMFREIPPFIPKGEVVATVPDNGGSLLYATTGIPTTTTHLYYTADEDTTYINRHLRDTAYDPHMCDVLKAHNIHWALAFGRSPWAPTEHKYTGFDKLQTASGFTDVLTIQGKTLYRIDTCWN